MPILHNPEILGLNINGDLAGMTFIQRGPGRAVAYVKTFPTKVPTPNKLRAILRFQAAAIAWRDLDQDHQQTLRLISKHFHMSIRGRELFMSCHIRNKMTWIEDYAQQIGRPW